MNTARAKQVPLRAFLAALGHHPARENAARGELWYLSPLRQETHPSFKVNEAKNLWYDFGLGRGGNIIDFAVAYFRSDVAQALREIEARVGRLAPVAPQPPVAPSEGFSPTVVPLQSRALIAYLARRGIPAEVSRPYVQEMHYQRDGKAYFALAFPNRSGGYELRNPYFKGSTSPKDITVIKGENPGVVAVFEGFMDFLSALAHKSLGGERPNVVVLNSAALRDRGLEAVGKAVIVKLYFDNDDAGEALTGYFRDRLDDHIVMDRRDEYAGHKDLNDLVASLRAPSASIEL